MACLGVGTVDDCLVTGCAIVTGLGGERHDVRAGVTRGVSGDLGRNLIAERKTTPSYDTQETFLIKRGHTLGWRFFRFPFVAR